MASASARSVCVSWHILDTRASAQPDGKVLDSIQGAVSGAGVSIILENTDSEGSGPTSTNTQTQNRS